MDEMLRHNLPATWLLQFDALVDGPYVPALKKRMPATHEVGFWFEMNEKLCRAAGVEWRGRAGYEWDSRPSIAFTIGYAEPERIKLADAAMEGFRTVWGRYPKSVASWNLDAISMAHLCDKYGIGAFAVCRDQIATDGFTIWGAPIAGYYPSKLNCWSPAIEQRNQIPAPVFRMLGQDPVYYYYSRYPLPDGRQVGEPDTMEPVWTSGRSPAFVREFLQMIAHEPCSGFSYAQLGQENNFGWPSMEEAYPKQMDALAQLMKAGSVHVETLGETGRRFKSSFRTTPTQVQAMLSDPYGNSSPAERTVWYQSRFYRANLHFRGDLPFLRDLTVYSDRNPQPFLTSATRESDVEQRMPAVLDGYHWSPTPGSNGSPGAGGFFVVEGERLRLTGEPTVSEHGNNVVEVDLPVSKGAVHVRFDERGIRISVSPTGALSLSFEWDGARSTFKDIQGNLIRYRQSGFDYAIEVEQGDAVATDRGWMAKDGRGVIRIRLAQKT
jgi:hypothetical protein